MTQNNLGILYIQTDRTEEGIDILKDVLNKRELLQDLGAGGFSVLGTGCERLGNRKEAAQCYLSSSAAYFHLFTRGVDCSEAVLGNLVKTLKLGEGEIRGDALTMLIALGKILDIDNQKDLKIPGKNSLSKRGEALKEALDGKKVDFDPDPKDEVDMMVLGIIKLLSSKP